MTHQSHTIIWISVGAVGLGFWACVQYHEWKNGRAMQAILDHLDLDVSAILPEPQLHDVLFERKISISGRALKHVLDKLVEEGEIVPVTGSKTISYRRNPAKIDR